ncbi:MAG: hypothetical protein IT460_09950 [Planctomycetes bacterium]|nr:hypothetical protein [Planctomycetota bacterium]
MRRSLHVVSSAIVLALASGCGAESGGKAPAAAKAAPTWVTVENPPPGNKPNDKVRHVDFTLRHPSTWTRDEGFRERDDRAFVRVHRRGEPHPYDLVFQVRSFFRAEPGRPVATFIDGVAESLTSVTPERAAAGDVKKLLRKGPTTVAGRPAQEVVVLESSRTRTGATLRLWRRMVLIELAPTEWGALALHAWIGGIAEGEDPEAPDVQAEMQAVFDSLTLKP